MNGLGLGEARCAVGGNESTTPRWRDVTRRDEFLLLSTLKFVVLQHIVNGSDLQFVICAFYPFIVTFSVAARP